MALFNRVARHLVGAALTGLLCLLAGCVVTGLSLKVAPVPPYVDFSFIEWNDQAPRITTSYPGATDTAPATEPAATALAASRQPGLLIGRPPPLQDADPWVQPMA